MVGQSAVKSGLETFVDIVMCIDATESMSPVLEQAKTLAKQFYGDITRRLTDFERDVTSFRIKVIAFRDYYHKDAEALVESDFFALPAETKAFEQFLARLKPSGGGDPAENALEALAIAISSPWRTQVQAKRRQVIVMFTDDGAHPLEVSRDPKYEHRWPYPLGRVPESFTQLYAWWNDENRIHQRYKRLILFAPAKDPWEAVGNEWDVVAWHKSEAGRGLSDVDYNAIVTAIAESLELAG